MILTIYANRESGKASTEHGMHNNLAHLLYEMCNDVDASHYKNFSVKLPLSWANPENFTRYILTGKRNATCKKFD